MEFRETREMAGAVVCCRKSLTEIQIRTSYHMRTGVAAEQTVGPCGSLEVLRA